MNPTLGEFDARLVAERLVRFLGAQGLAEVEIERLRRFTVGFSWITFGFTAHWRDGAGPITRELILRVGPPNGIFAPYRASPEYLTLGALRGSGVPVPQVYWHSDSSEDFGAPFFICEFVRGEAPIPWTHDGGPAFDEAMRKRLAEQFVSALAALHSFEWRGSPVEAIDGARDVTQTAHAQVEFWRGRLAQWSPSRVPLLEWAAIWLHDHAPVAPKVSVVHGDCRIGNFLVDEGRITAILDWEIVRLGDPLEDVGYLCMQAWRGRSPYMCHLFTREELRDRYTALSGIDIDDRAVRYWEAFGTYKLAVMHFGAQYCFETRRYNDMRMAGMSAQIPRMLLQVETAMERAA